MTIRSWLVGVATVGVVAAGAAMAAAPAASASGQLPHAAAVNKVTSQKWAGYAALADSRKDFRYVAADFIVRSPHVCHTDDNQPGSVTTTQWIGLGGYSRGITEQIGVVETCAFMDDDEWEFWASYSGTSGSGAFFDCEEVHGDTCPHGIDGGDRIELSVYYNGKSYRLILRDVTKKISRTIYERCSKCTSKSAEVISLAASTATNPPLTSLSNVSFFGLRVTSADGKHGTMAPQPRYWTTAEITRLDSAGDIVGKPYPLLRHGRGFSVFAYGFTGP
jgi:Peptidase A4 family